MDKNKEKKSSDMLYIISLIGVLCIIFFGLDGIQGNKGEIVIVLVCIAVTAVLFGVYIKNKLLFHQYAFLCIILFGGMSLLVQPILNIPDETTHFARAEIVSEGRLIIDPDEQYHKTIKTVEDMSQEAKKTILTSDLKGAKVDNSQAVVQHVAASNLTLMYIPSAIGILFAKILRMDAIWLLWFGRFTNLLCYAILIASGIKIAPKFKFVLFFVALLPMSIQQAASCSPDAFINGLCLFFIGFFLYLYNKESTEIKEIVCFVLLGFLITVSKLSNICIAGLVLLLPFPKTYNKKTVGLLKSVAIIATIIVGGGYYIYTTTFAPNLQLEPYLTEANVNSGEQIQYILNNFVQWLRDFVGNLINMLQTYITQLSQFGWLDYGYPILSVITIFMFSKICFQENGLSIKVYHKFLILLMVVGTYGISCLALYISWTSVGSSGIEGVQGRYFIPIIALLSLVLAPANKEKIEQNHMVDVLVSLAMVSSMIIVTGVRYY